MTDVQENCTSVTGILAFLSGFHQKYFRLIFVVIKLIYDICIKLKTNNNFVQYLQKWYIFVTDVQFSKIFKTRSKSLQKAQILLVSKLNHVYLYMNDPMKY